MIMATGLVAASDSTILRLMKATKLRTKEYAPAPQLIPSNFHLTFSSSSLCSSKFCDPPSHCLSSHFNDHGRRSVHHCDVIACVSSSASAPSTSLDSTRLYVSGLSFRTTEESLRNAFQQYGQLIEVNLVMDKIANRPRGFAFLRYATEEESKKAIEGMHGKFLDSRVIFVEVAKPRSQVQKTNQNPR